MCGLDYLTAQLSHAPTCFHPWSGPPKAEKETQGNLNAILPPPTQRSELLGSSEPNHPTDTEPNHYRSTTNPATGTASTVLRRHTSRDHRRTRRGRRLLRLGHARRRLRPGRDLDLPVRVLRRRRGSRDGGRAGRGVALDLTYNPPHKNSSAIPSNSRVEKRQNETKRRKETHRPQSDKPAQPPS